MPRREVLSLYRQLLKYGKVYPTKNREGLLKEIKAEFREGKGLSNRADIEEKIAVARSGIEQMRLFCKIDKKTMDWSVSLGAGSGSASNFESK